MPRLTSAALVALVALLAGNASGMPVTTSFTAAGLVPDSAPTSPVTGTITWEAASLTAPIESLTSISLIIGGHAYALDEVGFLSSSSDTMVIIGGTALGVVSVAAGTDDFWLMFDRSSAEPRQFLYTAAGTGADFSTMTFASFSISESSVVPRSFAADPSDANAVPEPSTLALLAAGLAGAAFGRRRRQSTRAQQSSTTFA